MLARASAAGFAAGTCVGIVGWGGTQIAVPALTHPAIGNLSQLAASAVSVCSQSVAASSACANYYSKGAVDVQIAATVALPAIVGARAGVHLARRLQPDVHALVFNGGSLLLMPTHFIVQRWRQKQQAQQPSPPQTQQQPRAPPQLPTAPSTLSSTTHVAGGGFGLVSFGLVSGALSSLMGVGGGPLAVSFLTVTTTLPHHLIQGTAACGVVPGMLAAGAFHLLHGKVPLAACAAVTAGSAAGGIFGAQVALGLSEDHLRQCYMASLLLLGGRSFVAAGRNLQAVAARRAVRK